MSKKVLVTGASGLLGRQVVIAFEEAGWQVTGTALTRAKPPTLIKLDLCDGAAIEQALDETKLLFTARAAQRFPDLVDKDPAAARALNVDATSALANATASRSIGLIYISTDYVFPGTEGEAPYEADATPAPPNMYGQLKLDGEEAVLAATSGKNIGLGVVLRVPVLYGPAESNKESAINTLIDSLHKSQTSPVTMDDWSIRYPTHTADVSRVLVSIATLLLPRTTTTHSTASSITTPAASILPQILQFSSEDRYTKYEICEVLAEILGLPLDNMVANKVGNEPGASVKRPFDCHLSTRALRELGVDVGTQDFKAFW